MMTSRLFFCLQLRQRLHHTASNTIAIHALILVLMNGRYATVHCKTKCEDGVVDEEMMNEEQRGKHQLAATSNLQHFSLSRSHALLDPV